MNAREMFESMQDGRVTFTEFLDWLSETKDKEFHLGIAEGMRAA